jgi:multisubunit Na+/H+ antiporter MnhG subunit
LAELRNPLGSEAAAFRFLVATAVYFGLIALGTAVSSWVGLATFLVLTAGVVWWVIARARRSAGSPDASH